MIDDQRTSPVVQLTLEDDSTTSKRPRKLPIILVAVFAAVAVVLLVTTILFGAQKSSLESEISQLKTFGDLTATTLTPKETHPAAISPTQKETHPPPTTTTPRVTHPAPPTTTPKATHPAPPTTTPRVTHPAPPITTPRVTHPAPPTTTPRVTHPAPPTTTPRVTHPAPPTTTPRVTHPAPSTPTHGETHEFCLTDQCNKSAAVVLSSMDRNRNPCDNFFEYACGGWTREQVIQDDQFEVTKFGEVRNDLHSKLKELIERAPQADDPASYAQVRSYYDACLDLGTINAQGTTPITQMLDSLGGWPVLGTNPGGNWASYDFDFEQLWATLRGRYNTDVVISTAVTIDYENTNRHILELSRPYFAASLDTHEKNTKQTYSLIPETVSQDYGRKLLLSDEFSDVRQAYLQYMVDVVVALGGNEESSRREMTRVLEMERTLANYAEDATESDFPRTTISTLSWEYTQINWQQFYDMLMPESVSQRVTSLDGVLNWYPSYVRNVDAWLPLQDNRVLANYMIWRLVDKMVPYLGENFLEIRQNYLRIATGVAVLAPAARWKTCISQVNSILPFATGRMYVDEYFSEDTKIKITEMIGNLKQALRSMISSSYWLDLTDRYRTQEKLDATGVAVGYPDWLKDNSVLDPMYADLTVLDNENFVNYLNYRSWIARKELGVLRLPVDRSLWTDTGPAVVNAYNYRYKNGITIPAAILQPPFYHPDFPWYLNYGGIGVVLGHEITHSFDSYGVHHDKDGNWRTWWSQESSGNFDDRVQCLIDQYSSFVVPENNQHVDGRQTRAENIADNGGLREAYKFYTENVPMQPRLPGVDLTEHQMIFLSYSQVWCGVMRPERANYLVAHGVHSPRRFRVIGPLQNNEAFNQVYDCPGWRYMNRYPKCKVWS